MFEKNLRLCFRSFKNSMPKILSDEKTWKKTCLSSTDIFFLLERKLSEEEEEEEGEND